MKAILLLAVAGCGLGGCSFAATELNMAKLHVDSYNVVGISVRTSNAQEMSGNSEIGPLWKRLRDEDVLIRIQHRTDGKIIAVYSDYESDRNGRYTYTLGAKVNSTRDVPNGMIVQKVQAGQYAMFTSQGGPAPQIVPALWKGIWSLEASKQLNRAYKTDFEVYYEGLLTDPSNVHLDIYIGLSK